MHYNDYKCRKNNGSLVVRCRITGTGIKPLNQSTSVQWVFGLVFFLLFCRLMSVFLRLQCVSQPIELTDCRLLSVAPPTSFVTNGMGYHSLPTQASACSVIQLCSENFYSAQPRVGRIVPVLDNYSSRSPLSSLSISTKGLSAIDRH